MSFEEQKKIFKEFQDAGFDMTKYICVRCDFPLPSYGDYNFKECPFCGKRDKGFFSKLWLELVVFVKYSIFKKKEWG